MIAGRFVKALAIFEAGPLAAAARPSRNGVKWVLSETSVSENARVFEVPSLKAWTP